MNLKNKVKNIRCNNRPVNNNDGIALLTVLLITIILSLLAIVAISTTGTDVLNAGSSTAAQYTFNIANSGMNVVLSQITTNAGTHAGPECAGVPLSGWYYYSTGGNICNAGSSPPASFTPANIINSYFNNSVYSGGNGPFPGNFNQSGYEYSGVYGHHAGYSCPNSNPNCFYNGNLNFLTQNSHSANTIQTGMTFSYGPVMNAGYP